MALLPPSLVQTNLNSCQSVRMPHATICRSLWGVLMLQCVESLTLQYVGVCGVSSCNNVLSLWGVLMQQCVESVGCPHATMC